MEELGVEPVKAAFDPESARRAVEPGVRLQKVRVVGRLMMVVVTDLVDVRVGFPREGKRCCCVDGRRDVICYRLIPVVRGYWERYLG